MGLLQALQPLNQYVLARHEEKGLLARAREERAARERELAADRAERRNQTLFGMAKEGFVTRGAESLASRLAPDLAADPLTATNGTGIAASLLQRARGGRTGVGAAGGLTAPPDAAGQTEALAYDPTQDRGLQRDIREATMRREEQTSDRAWQTQRDAAQAARDAERDRRQHGYRLGEIDRQNAGDVARVQAAAQYKPTRALPLGVMKTIADNEKQLSTIDEAITSLGTNPQAVGWKTYVPKKILDAGSTAGEISTRAAVADFGSMTIRDRSGAAVTAAEFPRIAPFIPSPTDDAKTAKAKLTRMREIIQEEADLYRANYGPDQGFQEFRTPSPRATTRGGAINDAPRRYSPDNPFAGGAPTPAPRGAGRSF